MPENETGKVGTWSRNDSKIGSEIDSKSEKSKSEIGLKKVIQNSLRKKVVERKVPGKSNRQVSLRAKQLPQWKNTEWCVNVGCCIATCQGSES